MYQKIRINGTTMKIGSKTTKYQIRCKHCLKRIVSDILLKYCDECSDK